MYHKNIESKVEELVEPIIRGLAYELYDVQYEKEGKDYYLRITIDKLGGITIEDCETVNHAIDDILDAEDIIATSYFLEVSSPGIERVLRKPWHFEKQIGKKIQVKLFQAIHKQKQIEGILKAYKENEIVLEVDGECLEIERKNVAIAKVVFEEEKDKA